MNMVACTNTECGVVEIPEGAKFCPNCGRALVRPVTGGGDSERRPVTVVFCDIKNSTKMAEQLDLEPLGSHLDTFHQTAQEVFGRHSGLTGALQGDSVMGVFGLPEASDDDALRAVRAAAELRDALAPLAEALKREHDLPFAVRIGVNTGQVLVRHDRVAVEEQVTGQEVALARRLEEHAAPGGILIGEETWQLVRDAIHTTAEVTLSLNGFAEPVKARVLDQVLPGKPGRIPHLNAPLVGRQLELMLLEDLFKRGVSASRCQLVTLVGEAGVGKTRLADELVTRIGDRAKILRGHCLSYGDVTWWPMKEIVKQAIGMTDFDSPTGSSEQFSEQFSERLADLLTDEERDLQALANIKALLGIGGEEATPGDTPLALRRLLENLARRKPLLVVIDDLHLADQTLLEAVEAIVEGGEEPILLLCMARPHELFARRRTWPRGWMNSATIALEPLKQEEGEKLLAHLLPGAMELSDDEMAHIARLTQGNPLTVEELVAMFVGKGWLRLDEAQRWIATPDVYRVKAPPGVNAILQARLDRLKGEERKIVERAAVVGEQFHAADVEALSQASAPDRVDAALETLVRNQIIQRDHTVAVPLTAEGSQGYRFRHILMRQAAYDRMTMLNRAELHERYADWLEQAAGERVSEIDELIATHLNEAYRYLRRQASASADDRVSLIGQRAGVYFAAAGRRAALRGDVQVAASLLGRTDSLLPHDHPVRMEALPDLADALQARGELGRAMSLFKEIGKASTSVGDQRTAVHAALGLLHSLAFSDLGSFMKNGREEILELLPHIEDSDDCQAAADGEQDCLALAKATYLLAYLDHAMGLNERARGKIERARALARKGGDERLEASIVRLQSVILYWGPTHVDEVERINREALELAKRTNRGSLEAGALTIAARIAAMRGEFDRAKRLSKTAERINMDLGELLTQAMDTVTEGVIGLLSNELTAAEQALRRGYDALSDMGGVGPKTNVAAALARVLLRQDRLDEAEKLTRQCEECAAALQNDAQAKWRSIRAVVLARHHRREDAETLAKEALELVDETDQPDTQAEVHMDYAEVLRLAGRRQEASRELKHARELYEEKGNSAAAKQISTGLVALR